MKIFSPKFYLAFGLTSMVISTILLATLSGFIPDRNVYTRQARVLLSESLASSSSLFLQANDFPSIRRNLEFVVERIPELIAASVTRVSDGSAVAIGEVPASLTDEILAARITVPVLDNTGGEWGSVELDFKPIGGVTWIERIQRSKIAFFALLVLFSFISFYLYLGKMLKQLNPAGAVPARVRSALDTIAESLLVINRKGDIVLANSAFSKLAGRKPEELVGTSVDSLQWSTEHSDDAPEAESSAPWHVALMLDRPSRNDMVWYEDQQGVRHKFLVNCSPVAGSKGKAGGVLISLDDVTLLEQKEQELMRSKEEAELANHAKSDFLSNMSHEIRTPMTAILGFTEVLKRGYSRDEASAQQYLGTISRSGKHLLGLINDILDLSKVESGNLEVESIQCSPHNIVNDVIQVLQVKANEKALYLRLRYSQALPEYINSDPARLRQIITNLVGNAIKFTESGGVEIALKMTEVDARQQIAIEVSDTGIGMTAEQTESVFQSFVQADSTITRRFGGTGLGLSISRDLAIAMGGDIHVTSEADVGSKFTAVVDVGDISGARLLSPEELEAASRQSEESVEETYYYADARILVVDDAQENRDLVRLILTQQGIKTDTAENGQEGLDKLFAGEYDLVLMDVQMPVMGGFEAVELMRKRGATLPVVALTANAMKGFEKEVEAAGYSHYMTKPIDLDALNQLLATLMPGKLVPVPEQPAGLTGGALIGSGAESDSSESARAQSSDGGKIYSHLVQKKPQFHPIAKSFIERIQARLPEFESAIDEQDMEQLAGLAHWLKGSGGSVGFDVFTDPAKALERAAKEHDKITILRRMTEIRDYSARLDAGRVEGENTEPLTIPVESRHSTVDDDDDADSVIISSLPLENPVFRDIVGRFIPKLEDNIKQMHRSLEAHDFPDLAALAHWLKGSGGNVGFHAFTEPSALLEQASKSGNYQRAKVHLSEVDRISKRVALDPPPDDQPLRKTA